MDKINENKNLIHPYTEEIIKNLQNLDNREIVEIGIDNFNKTYTVGLYK